MVQHYICLDLLRCREQSLILESQPSEKTTSSLLCPNPNNSLVFTLALASNRVLCLSSAVSHPQFQFPLGFTSLSVCQCSKFFAPLKISHVIKIPRQFTYQPRKPLAHLGLSALHPSSYLGNTAIIFNKLYRKIQQHRYQGEEPRMLVPTR